jgi:hypothetical protein
MNRKRFAIVMTLGMMLLAVLLWAGPALAISNGEPDGDGHPNVGMIWADVPNVGLVAVCSGAKVEPAEGVDYDVFLTAAHCLYGAPEGTVFLVTFDSTVIDFSVDPPAFVATLIPAVDHAFDPQFGHDRANLHDLGVLLLPPGSTMGIEPAELPYAGELDDMKRNHELRGQDFVNVGYGVIPEWKRGPVRFGFNGLRNTSTSPFMALTQYWLQLHMNNDATGQGGVCFGDSGSPHFLPGTNRIFATTTGGDPNCRSLNYNYRLDTDAARGFLGDYVALP